MGGFDGGCGRSFADVNTAAGSLSVYDVANDRMLPDVPVGLHPTAMLFDKASTRLYVANSNEDTISALDLTAKALAADPNLDKFTGHVADSGEGRWTVAAAIDEGVPAHVLSAALYERFSSRGQAGFADQLLSAMRYEFGGHVEKPAGS